MVSTAVEERLAEMAAIEAGWFEDDDAPVRPSTIANARWLIDTLGFEPYEIMPVRGTERAGGTWLVIEWRGPYDQLHIDVGHDALSTDFLGCWMVIDREGPHRRSVEFGGDPGFVKAFLKLVCEPVIFPSSEAAHKIAPASERAEGEQA